MAIREIYHDADTMKRHVAAGAWANRTLDDYVSQHARERGDNLSMTASGKVQKHLLRDEVARLIGHEPLVR
jgi:non-ribosomal peptide synthetase component E (peptide arylation enzyme)